MTSLKKLRHLYVSIGISDVDAYAATLTKLTQVTTLATPAPGGKTSCIFVAASSNPFMKVPAFVAALSCMHWLRQLQLTPSAPLLAAGVDIFTPFTALKSLSLDRRVQFQCFPPNFFSALTNLHRMKYCHVSPPKSPHYLFNRRSQLLQRRSCCYPVFTT